MRKEEIRVMVHESFEEVFGNNDRENVGDKKNHPSTFLNNYYLTLSRGEEWAKAMQKDMFEEIKKFVEEETGNGEYSNG